MIQPSIVNKYLRPVSKELTDFLAFYFEGGLKLKPPQECIFQWEGVTTVVLYREGEFQVEMVVIDPGVSVPTHVHDDVESYEVSVGGKMEFFVEGVQTGYFREPKANGMSRDFGKYVPIRADAWHQGRAGDIGVCFLSVQRWHGRAPTCVGQNWRGKTMGATHEQIVE